MKKFFVSLCFALGIFFITKLDTNAAEYPFYSKYDNSYGFVVTYRTSVPLVLIGDTSNPNHFYGCAYNYTGPFYTYWYSPSNELLYTATSSVSVEYYSNYFRGNPSLYVNGFDSSGVILPYTTTVQCPLYKTFSDIPPAISKSDLIDSFGGDGFNINGSLNGNTVDVFKCNPFRLLSTDYMYYEVSIKSLKQFSGSKAIVKLIGDRSTYTHTVTNPFLTSFDTIPVDDYVSVNSDFYMICTPIDSNDNYGNSIVYKYRLTQDGIISVYDDPIDTPKGLNVDINNNYIPVTHINKNRAFVTNIDYSSVTYNSMNVEYSNTWDVYYAPSISTSNDNISIQNITDSYNTYNYVTNNYNDLTYGLGLNFDFGDNDISDDGNVIDTLDDIKVLLSFLPWLLGLFTFIPSGFVTIILGGFTILLVVVVVKIFK